MTYAERYAAGEHVQVWDELTALGDAVRRAPLLADAESVARMTMERVAANVDQLVNRLAAHGYDLGKYPDGTKLGHGVVGRAEPNSQSLGYLKELRQSVGMIPLSLDSFWQVVGSVSLIGRARGEWPEYSDPLYVIEPRGALAEFHEWQDDPYRSEKAHKPFTCPIAPDFIHKDNVSGGEPYSIQLPNPGADAVLRNEWHNTTFIQYLRIAILEWGGFPGLSPANPFAKWRSGEISAAALSRLRELTSDLVSF